MTRLLLYTGNGGAGVTTCAAATARRLAQRGTPTALVSIDRTQSVSDAYGVPVGPEPTTVRPDLTAVEINPQAGQETFQGTVEQVGSVASVAGIDFTDGHVATFVESTHIPFGREVAALEAVASFVGDADYEAVVFDTGLHGRILRLLQLPGVLGIGVDIASEGLEMVGDGVEATTDRLATATGQVLDPLRSPFAVGDRDDSHEDGEGVTTTADGESDGAADRPAEEGAADRELLESKVARVRSIIGGAGSREVRVVTTPDRIAARWTDHLVRNIRKAGIPAGPLVVNKVLQDGSCCARCRAIRTEQQAALRDLRGREGLTVRELPDLHGELDGEALLDRLAEGLLAEDPAGEDGPDGEEGPGGEDELGGEDGRAH